MKKNKRLSLILVSVLLLTFTVFFCCCGIDTSTVAGSASQVVQQDETEDEVTDEYDDEDLDDEDIDDSLESEEPEELTEDSDDEDGITTTYVLNTSKKKFHYPDCYSVKQMKDKNKKIEETTREALIERGYDPCGNCNP